MDSYAGTADLHLIAIGVVIWVVAVSVAFGFYIPVLRQRRQATVSPGHGTSWRAMPPAAPEPARPEPARPEPVCVEIAPVAPIAEAPAPVIQPEPRTLDAAAPVRAVPAPDEPQGDEFSVLIVDDNAINRQVLEMILDSVSVAHASVENGLQAVQAVAAHTYDAVLMDLQMPVMDGFEATRRIRALEVERGAAPAKIIVVSANCMDEHVAAGREAGADDHMPKPISAAALIGALESCAVSAPIAA